MIFLVLIVLVFSKSIRWPECFSTVLAVIGQARQMCLQVFLHIVLVAHSFLTNSALECIIFSHNKFFKFPINTNRCVLTELITSYLQNFKSQTSFVLLCLSRLIFNCTPATSSRHQMKSSDSNKYYDIKFSHSFSHEHIFSYQHLLWNENRDKHFYFYWHNSTPNRENYFWSQFDYK